MLIRIHSPDKKTARSVALGQLKEQSHKNILQLRSVKGTVSQEHTATTVRSVKGTGSQEHTPTN